MAIWCDKELLKACEQLHQAGLVPAFREGEKLARGFADLGFEEFMLLPNSQLLSLVNGKVSALPEEHKKFFFWLPDVDEISVEIFKRGFLLERAEWQECRDWVVSFRQIPQYQLDNAGEGGIQQAQGETLNLSLARALLAILEVANSHVSS